MHVTLDQPRMVGKSSGRSALAISAAILTALVLVQAILAGRGWFVDHDFIDIHGVVADVVVLAAVAQAVIAFLAVRRRQVGWTLFGLSLAILVLVAVQLGLGYAGRDSGTAASLHVPNGVLIFGLSIATTVLTWGRGRAASGASRRGVYRPALNLISRLIFVEAVVFSPFSEADTETCAAEVRPAVLVSDRQTVPAARTGTEQRQERTFQ